MPCTSSRSSAAVSAGVRSAAMTMPGSVTPVAGPFPTSWGTTSPAHPLPPPRPQVLPASPQVLVVEATVLSCDRLGRFVPGLGGVPALLEDRTAGRLHERMVFEEEQMSIEDCSAVLAGPGGNRVARRADLRPNTIQRPLERFPLRFRVARRLGGNLGRRSPEVASGAHRKPRRGRGPGDP